MLEIVVICTEYLKRICYVLVSLSFCMIRKLEISLGHDTKTGCTRLVLMPDNKKVPGSNPSQARHFCVEFACSHMCGLSLFPQ